MFRKQVSATIALLLLAGGSVAAQDDAKVPDDDVFAAKKAEIQEAVKRFEEAFNKGDADALAAAWSPDAVYVNRTTGTQVTGREAIAKQYEATFAARKGVQMKINVDSVSFVSPNVAVEHGTAILTEGDMPPEPIDYRAVYVHRDGQWLLDRVTDRDEPQEAPSHYEQLKDLGWMVGKWASPGGETQVVTECNWTRNRNYLTRAFTVSTDDVVEMAGMQIIGWDANAKKIRSWTFDSDGGFALGTWKRKDNRWTVHRTGVTADGRKVSGVNVVTFLDNDSFTLRTVSRSVGGQILPNLEEILIERQ